MENEEVREVNQYVAPNTNNTHRRNPIAAKFAGVASIIKFFGYGAAILTALGIMLGEDMEGEAVFIGIIVGVVVAIITWLSCLMWEAIAEGLQLLEDIKNK